MHRPNALRLGNKTGIAVASAKDRPDFPLSVVPPMLPPNRPLGLRPDQEMP